MARYYGTSNRGTHIPSGGTTAHLGILIRRISMETIIALSPLALGIFLLWQGWGRAFLVWLFFYIFAIPVAVILLYG